jgi:hypothetical protein
MGFWTKLFGKKCNCGDDCNCDKEKDCCCGEEHKDEDASAEDQQ